MTTTVQSEYRNLPLDSLTESSMNPSRSFDEAALTELADYVPRHKMDWAKPLHCSRPYGH